MTDKQILDCEYLIKINEMRTCKALNVSFYGDIICRDCIILKLKKQLQAKEQELEYYKIQFNADTKEMDDYQNEIVTHLESIEYWIQQFKAKEQEYDILRKMFADIDLANIKLHNELDQFKAEVKNKTEYIQEQRDIINQYSKEIEMYKKCQGKRASKREQELKAELEQEKNWHKTADEISKANSEYTVKLKQTLTEIKEIVEPRIVHGLTDTEYVNIYSETMEQILQKINEVEDDK